jgi:glyoxylase-like metal-dependent hydrolase (beta-lactamase superfamily II)
MKLGKMEVDVVGGGAFRLDGGTMFGPVPRVLWERQIPPDERHRIPMTANCLLVRVGGSIVLVDAGYGSKADGKRRDFQALEEGGPIVRSLAAHGVRPEDVDLVVLTHLHFDHVGGCTMRDESGSLRLVFSNADHVVQRSEWEDAVSRRPELLGSYFEEDFLPLEAAGRLQLVDGEVEILPGVRVRRVGGHTRGMQIVELGSTSTDPPLGVALSDLAPTTAHLKTFWQVSYDQFPLDVRRIKPIELGRIADCGALAFLCHDTRTRWAYLKRDSKQEFVASSAP